MRSLVALASVLLVAAPAFAAPPQVGTPPVDKLMKVGTKATAEWIAPLKIHPMLVSADGSGGAYVFDQRTMAPNDIRIAVMHLGPSGAADPGFGSGGEMVLGPSGTSLLQGVTLDARGRVAVLVSQKANSGSQTFLVVYRFASGKLDSSFNGGGATTVTIPTPTVTSRTGPVAIAADSAGRLVIAGTDDPSAHRQVFVVRVTDNGSLDLGFARGVAVSSYSNYAFDVARVTVDASTGNLTVVANKQVAGSGISAGAETVRAGSGIALFRFDANGAVDSKFGNQGVAWYDGESVTALDAVAGSGGVVVAGYLGTSATTMKPVLLRWTDSGALDSTFGMGGRTSFGLTPGTSLFRFRRVARDGMGRLVAVASSRTAQDTPVTTVARFSANGVVDPTFGAGGSGGNVSFNVQTADPEIDPQGGVFFRAP
jgi:uncharacterized delta-60 repeat protein